MGLGQFTGDRATYKYEMDGGQEISLVLDETLAALPDTGLVALTSANNSSVGSRPAKFTPRGVYWEATATGFVGKRKFLVCGEVTAGLYASNTSQQVTIDGVVGVTTGKKGEKLSFNRLSLADPTP